MWEGCTSTKKLADESLKIATKQGYVLALSEY